jgi:hypothetical protein
MLEKFLQELDEGKLSRPDRKTGYVKSHTLV